MKNLRLRVGDNGEVLVSAPYSVSREKIDEFVSSRTDWINARRSELSERQTELSDNSPITIFGEIYTVKFERGGEKCEISGELLLVTLPDPENTAHAEQLVLSYMAKLCREVLETAFVRYLKLSEFRGTPPMLRLALLKSCWGSCNRRSNVITLNLYLCKLPKRFAEYVAAHEVTHLFVPNHSDDFYKFGERLYSGFRSTDRELNKKRTGNIFS